MKKSEKIPVQNHSELVKAVSRLNDIISKDNRLGMLLMVDPVSALKDAGFVLSGRMVEHVEKRIKDIGLSIGQRGLYKRVKNGKVRLPWVDRVVFGDLDKVSPRRVG
ncbi:MAG: hypothetical protein Q8O19_07745 [Rectinemataceae bacterium]|nr:hypothetical protein [Rectinemataceae bacterium]